MNRSETIRMFGTTPCVSPHPLAFIFDYIDCFGLVKGGTPNSVRQPENSQSSECSSWLRTT